MYHGPLSRYVKLRVAHAPGMPGTFSPPPRVNDPDMHHGTCVTHVPRCMSGSLTSGFHWGRWRGKRSRHSRCMRKPQFNVSGKRPVLMLYGVIVCMVASGSSDQWGIGHDNKLSQGIITAASVRLHIELLYGCDDYESTCTLSQYRNQIENMTHLPLFRVRSWNNGMRCLSFYILIQRLQLKVKRM